MARRRQFRRPIHRPGPPRVRTPAVAWRRAAVAGPVSRIELRETTPWSDGERPAQGVWELVVREGWEWTRDAAGHYRVRVATLTDAQADVVREWLELLTAPATWWAVNRELAMPDSEPQVAAALAAHPWLTGMLAGLLEASTEGAPPPPPDADTPRDSAATTAD